MPAEDHLHVITLVHGTFAQDAAWALSGSPLRTHLSSKLGPKVIFAPFRWSGANSHDARITASRTLCDHLRLRFQQYPQARHFIVAHSHGGNVACYALRALDIRQRLGGIVTLGTPFLLCRPRSTPASIEALKVMARDALSFAITAAVAVSVAWIAFTNSQYGADPWMVIASWLAAAAFTVVTFIGVYLRLKIWIERLHVNLECRRASRVEELLLPSPGQVGVFSIAVEGDEAGRYLRLLHRVASLPAMAFGAFDASLRWYGSLLLEEDDIGFRCLQ